MYTVLYTQLVHIKPVLGGILRSRLLIFENEFFEAVSQSTRCKTLCYFLKLFTILIWKILVMERNNFPLCSHAWTKGLEKDSPIVSISM